MLYKARPALKDARVIRMAEARDILCSEEHANGAILLEVRMGVCKSSGLGPILRSDANVHECILPIIAGLEDR